MFNFSLKEKNKKQKTPLSPMALRLNLFPFFFYRESGKPIPWVISKRWFLLNPFSRKPGTGLQSLFPLGRAHGILVCLCVAVDSPLKAATLTLSSNAQCSIHTSVKEHLLARFTVVNPIIKRKSVILSDWDGLNSKIYLKPPIHLFLRCGNLYCHICTPRSVYLVSSCSCSGSF